MFDITKGFDGFIHPCFKEDYWKNSLQSPQPKFNINMNTQTGLYTTVKIVAMHRPTGQQATHSMLDAWFCPWCGVNLKEEWQRERKAKDG